MLWAIHGSFMVLLFYWLMKQWRANGHTGLFYIAFIVKLIIVIGASYYFLFYVKKDVYWYLNDLERLNETFSFSYKAYFDGLFFKDAGAFRSDIPHFYHDERPWFFLRLLSPLYLIVRDYWLLSGYLGFFTFWCFSSLFFRTSYNSSLSLAVFFSLFLFPSLVFWTSGMLKESITTGLLVYLIAKVFFDDVISVKSNLFMLLAFFILFGLKYYLAALLLVSAVPYLVVKKWNIQYKFLWSGVIICLMVFCVSFLHPNLQLGYVFEALKLNYETMKVKGGDAIYYNYNDGLFGLIIQFPKAVFDGLFRPFLFVDMFKDKVNFIAIVENSLVMLLFLHAANLGFRRKHKIDFKWFSLSIYLVLSAGLIAFSCSNVGALHRYRVGYYFLFLIPVFYIVIKKYQKSVFDFIRVYLKSFVENRG